MSPHFYDHLKGWSEEQTEACIDREQEQPWLDRKALQTFGCWAGYRFDRVEWPPRKSHTLNLHLTAVGKAIMHCQKVQGKTMRRVRDLPLWDSRG